MSETKKKKREKTIAVLLRAGHPIAVAETAALGGDVVEVCFDRTTDETLVSCGRAKVSRARRYISDDELMINLPRAAACMRGTSLLV